MPETFSAFSFCAISASLAVDSSSFFCVSSFALFASASSVSLAVNLFCASFSLSSISTSCLLRFSRAPPFFADSNNCTICPPAPGTVTKSTLATCAMFSMIEPFLPSASPIFRVPIALCERPMYLPIASMFPLNSGNGLQSAYIPGPALPSSLYTPSEASTPAKSRKDRSGRSCSSLSVGWSQNISVPALYLPAELFSNVSL